MLPLEYYITELNRRLNNLIKLGTVVEINLAGAIPYARVKIGDLTTSWLTMLMPKAGENKQFHAKEIGEQVLVLCPGGNIAQGLIIGSIHQNRYPIPVASEDIHHIQYQDGAVIAYNRKEHHLAVTLPQGATIELTALGGITIEGNVTIQGHLTVDGDISDQTRSMKDDRGIYNNHNHPNTGKVLQKQ